MNNPEKMSYQVNKSGSDFVVFFIALNMVYTIFTLKFMPITLAIGTFTLFNIAISLVAFLGSTKYKIYQIKWAYGGIVLALIQAGRILFLPVEFEPGLRMFLIVVLELSAVLLVIGSLITIRKSKVKQAFEQTQAPAAN